MDESPIQKSTDARPARERILAAASMQFYAKGVRAVGVEDILAQAGATRATFYKYFRSKDDLVVQYVQRRDEAWRRWLRDAVESSSRDPARRPLAVFTALAQRFSQEDFRGCAFTGCIFEFPDRNHAAHVAARDHKREVIAYLRELLETAELDDAGSLAEELMMLIDGAVVTAVREHSARAAHAAQRIASVLLEQAKKVPRDGSVVPSRMQSAEVEGR